MAFALRNHIVCVVYDGIANSVFQSQVLIPLHRRINPGGSITIISCEKQQPSKQLLTNIAINYPAVRLIIIPRWPFFGEHSLWLSIRHLAKFFMINRTTDLVIARGPLAGLACIKVLSLLGLPTPLIIQARGLCAQEHRFSHSFTQSSAISCLKNKLMYNALESIEKKVYATRLPTAHIESVSLALTKYLITHFNADPVRTTLAIHDLPAPLSLQQKAYWRSHIRTLLHIPESWHVWCYSGSYKPWQCAQETISLFAARLAHDQHNFLLILTTDQQLFDTQLARHGISTEHARVMYVQPDQLEHYLAAADTGMLLRHADPINWVSRPTKMLEYQAAGLAILHNNSIAWLVEK